MGANKQFILITWATSWIWLSIAFKFLAEGYGVIFNFRWDKANDIQILSWKLNKYTENKDYIFLNADISIESTLYKQLDTIPEEIKNNIFAIVNNAAILRRWVLDSLTQKDWEDVFSVNVFAIISLVKWWKANCKNLQNIVNIWSIRWIPHVTRTNNMIYSISKSVIPSLTAVLAKDLWPKIRVNSISPGTIDTKQRQWITIEENDLYWAKNSILNRLWTTQEIADLCFFIINTATYLTWSNIVMDGWYAINYIK